MVKKFCKILGNFFAYCLEISGHEFPDKSKIQDSEIKNNEFFDENLIHKWLYGGDANGKLEEQE